MKKVILLALVLFCFLLNGVSQFLEFRPYNSPSSNSSSSQYYQQDTGQTYRTTGYILNSQGYIVKKIQIKVSVVSSGYRDVVKIVAYYRVAEGFGAQWEKVSITANEIGGSIPVFEDEKRVYSNFTYWANWGTDKIWFN